MHHRINRWLIAALLVFSQTAPLRSGSGFADDRPQPQQTTLSRPGRPVYVAIVGAIARPGVYRFENRPSDHRAPTVADLIEQAGSLTGNASGTIRIIRDQRSGLQIYCSPNNPAPLLHPLFDHDVVLVEDRSSGTQGASLKSNRAVALTDKRTHVVCVNLIDRPVVLPLREKHASLQTVLALLNQSRDISSEVQIIEPGSRRPDASGRFDAADRASRDENRPAAQSTNADALLSDGTVFIFKPSRVDQSRIPELPPAITAVQYTEAAPLAPTAARPAQPGPPRRGEATGLVADERDRERPVINPSEPAPFPEEAAQPVAPLPFGDSRTPQFPKRVEKLPSPHLSGPHFESPSTEANGPAIKPVPDAERFPTGRSFLHAVPPDVSPRVFAERDTGASSKRRLTQNFGETLDIPDSNVPYHPGTATASREKFDRKPGRNDLLAAEFADDDASRDLKSSSSTTLWVLTGLGIVILLAGRVLWTMKPRFIARSAVSAAASLLQVPAEQNVSAASSPVTAPRTLLSAILENQYPVVHEPFPLAGPLTLNGRLDIERLLRADPSHELPAPLTQSRGFTAIRRETSSESRMVSMTPTGETFSFTSHAKHAAQDLVPRHFDRGNETRSPRRSPWDDASAVESKIPVAVPIGDETSIETASPLGIEQRREKTVTRLMRITQADKRKARARTAARRLQRHVGDLAENAKPKTSRPLETPAPPTVPVASAPWPHLPRHDAERSTMNHGASVQEGRLDRALAHLQRERKI
ncbi:MAG: hypothetical protein WEB58_16630 [Planctomycetaceae bacterium]